MKTPAKLQVPTIYLREKLDKLTRYVEHLEEVEDRPAENTSKEWQIDQLREIRGLASVIHQEADEWLNVVLLDRPAPRATIVKVYPDGA